jgi:hypothetical protein
MGPTPLFERIKEYHDDVATKLRRLQSLKAQLALYDTATPSAAETTTRIYPDNADIFLVHGHAEAPKQEVARLVSGVTGRDPVILHEQPNRGRTVIESSRHIQVT